MDSVSSSVSSVCFLCSVFSHVFYLPPQGTKTMWQLTLLPTLASINLTADTASTHWRSTGRSSFSRQQTATERSYAIALISIKISPSMDFGDPEETLWNVLEFALNFSLHRLIFLKLAWLVISYSCSSLCFHRL